MNSFAQVDTPLFGVAGVTRQKGTVEKENPAQGRVIQIVGANSFAQVDARKKG